MHIRSIIAAVALVGAFAATPAGAQMASDEQDFQALGAALKADDSERSAAIETCVAQGIGDNPTGAAEFMGVPVEKAAKAWCLRMTSGIAEGKLTLADVQGLNQGNISPGAAKVLTTPVEGE